MKHNLQITLLLLTMFIVTQFIGLYVVSSDPFFVEQEINGTTELVPNKALSWMYPTSTVEEVHFPTLFIEIVISFIIAIVLIFLLTKFNVVFFLRAWFFVVVSIALFIAFSALLIKLPWTTYLALFLAIPLSFIKIYKRNIMVHNFTELFIYPGIAVVFVPLLNLATIIALLILISVYDMWAVWRSGIMQKMAKYQMNNLHVFSGFLVPNLTKKMKLKIESMKNSKAKKKGKVKINIALLGGGDVIFPIIAAGVMLNFGIWAALSTTLGATLGLSYLFFYGQKKKFYPAMPFISAGIFAGMIVYFSFFFVFTA